MDAFSGQLKKVNLKKKKPRGSFVINGIRRLALFFYYFPTLGRPISERKIQQTFPFWELPNKKQQQETEKNVGPFSGHCG